LLSLLKGEINAISGNIQL